MKKKRRNHNYLWIGLKLRFIGWLYSMFPDKYCWADCVAWAYSRKWYTPFYIDKAEACRVESIEKPCKSCYCGGWSDGKCWGKLPKGEREKIIAESGTQRIDFPF